MDILQRRELRGITYNAGYSGLDRTTLGLVRLPRVDSCAGFVFASFAADGPSLEEHLGHAAPYLKLVSVQGPEGIRLSAGPTMSFRSGRSTGSGSGP